MIHAINTKMVHPELKPFLSAVALLLLSSSLLLGHGGTEAKAFFRPLNTEIFYSPPIVLSPGSAANKFFYNVSFPRGHIAIKSFHAEVVDDNHVRVPLSETYLHHWVVVRYFARKTNQSDIVFRENDGICDNSSLPQYYGLGSETRKTKTWVPDPYGVVVGDPRELPEGYEEAWMINVHAIDTRGVEDPAGCTECRCDLYNVTVDENGAPLPAGYVGGRRCCYDNTRCKLKEGGGADQHQTRTVYLKYMVEWYDMDDGIVPVKVYIFDVTDERWASNAADRSGCKVEYDVKACETSNGTCVDSKKATVTIPTAGDLIYGVAHQHSAGIGSKLYGQDGRLLCGSDDIYGDGAEAGNESGYVVGMTTCYPHPGSVKISEGELLTLESDYNNTKSHTGLMGLFYILVAPSTSTAPSPN